MSAFDQLRQRQLIVVTGKGGVGKTTIAAALARLLARAGRRTLVLEVDPRESLHQLLGTEPSGGALVPAGGKLTAQNLQATAVIENLVRERIRLKPLARQVIASPIFQHFVAGAPGLREMAVLGYALRTVSGEYRHRADVVVLDAPATGHGASLLAAPLLLKEAIGGGQLGDMAQELAGFIADPDRCGVVLAALAEEMPVQETIELIELLRERLGRPPELVVANGLYPPFPAGSRRGKGGGEAAVELWRQRRAINDRELARLAVEWKGPVVQLPLLPLDRGPELLARVVERLGEALA